MEIELESLSSSISLINGFGREKRAMKFAAFEQTNAHNQSKWLIFPDVSGISML